jgi:hypothetical protein
VPVAEVKTPHFLDYSGNVIVSTGRGSVVPYARPVWAA